MTEVDTFLQRLAGRIGELEAQVAASSSTAGGSKENLRADAERLARIADVELAAGRPASFDSRITLDALQDAQADIVARVESTAKDLHDSIERDGRVTSPRGNWRPTQTSSPAPTASTSNSISTSPSAPSAPSTPRTHSSTSSAAPDPALTPATQPAPADVSTPEPAEPEVDLATVFAELDQDPLGEAKNALDGVLDDVMGTFRSSD